MYANGKLAILLQGLHIKRTKLRALPLAQNLRTVALNVTLHATTDGCVARRPVDTYLRERWPLASLLCNSILTSRNLASSLS
jgi:hypothetical protein